MSAVDRLDVLDSLRGWAILAVICIHVSQFAPFTSPLLQKIASNGDMGVVLFYVLSAFSLVMSLRAREDAGHVSVRAYAIRRLFRIAPMFWIAVCLSAILYFHKPGFWSPDGIGWGEIVVTALFLHGLHPATVNAVVPGGWSVAIEMMFYLLLPFMFRYGKGYRRLFGWLLVSLLLGILFGNVLQTYWSQALPEQARYLAPIYAWNMSLPAQLPVFVLGMLAYQMTRARPASPRLTYALFLIVGVWLLIADLGVWSQYRHWLWGGVFSCLIVAAYTRPVWLLDNPALRAMGRVSFSVYLLHFILLTYLSRVFRHLPLVDAAKFFVLYASTVMLTYAVAAWTYRRIELPFMRLGAQWSRKYEE